MVAQVICFDFAENDMSHKTCKHVNRDFFNFFYLKGILSSATDMRDPAGLKNMMTHCLLVLSQFNLIAWHRGTDLFICPLEMKKRLKQINNYI